MVQQQRIEVSTKRVLLGSKHARTHAIRNKLCAAAQHDHFSIPFLVGGAVTTLARKKQIVLETTVLHYGTNFVRVGPKRVTCWFRHGYLKSGCSAPQFDGFLLGSRRTAYTQLCAAAKKKSFAGPCFVRGGHNNICPNYEPRETVVLNHKKSTMFC